MDRNNEGFTLVELLAVIVVLAIIMILAIPAILDAVNAAKKESFFLYAQSLQSKAIAKYTQDLEHHKENTDCAVYDISKDLEISDVGNYEGWVRVSREAASSGKREVHVSLENSSGLQYVRYCTEKANSCEPNTSFLIADGTKSTIVSQIIDEGYVMCVNYQYPSGNKLVTVSKVCQRYSDGSPINDSYTYKVTMTLKDANYAVENTVFNKDMSMSEFYQEIDAFKEKYKDRKTNKLAIAEPSCDANAEIKGTTTTRQITEVTTSSTTRDTTDVTVESTTTRGTENVTTTTTTRDTANVTTTTTTVGTTQDTTTTIDVKDTSLLLRSLSVSGYDIQFNQLTFNYDLVVPNSVESLNISAVPMEDITTVTGTGVNQISVGTNPIVIELFNTVTGNKSHYRITVKRLDASGNIINTTKKPQDPNWNPESGLPDPTLEESDASLSHLSISGYALKFDPNVYDYTLETNGEKELFVSYRTTSKGATVSVSGDKDATDGSQVVVYVQSQNGYYTKSYTIKIAHRKQDSTGTKVLKGAAVGLGVVLAATLSAIAFTKKRKGKVKDDDKEDKKEQQNNNVSGDNYQ